METLMKQIRLKFTGAEEENKFDPSSRIDHKIQSFKDKKKAQNWFQRQSSRNMSHDYDSTEMEHATSIAAAAFAIHSQEGYSEIPQKKKIIQHPETSFTKTKSKVKDTKSPFSLPSVASKRSVSFKFGNEQDKEEPISSVIITEDKNPEKPITPEPSLKNTSSFGANSKYSSDEKKPEITAPKRTPSFGDIKPETPPPFYQHVSLRPPPPPPPPPPPMRQASTKPDPIRPPTPASGTRGQSLTRAGTFETKADAWERNELQKIKERYERLIMTIDSWEKRKKMKARSRLNKHEQSEDEQKRVKAVKKYQSKIKYIEEIGAGARAESVERRRNEEFKAKEKANIIRTTGNLPRTCCCF